ncbi:hypothetical protein F4802DRAFT_519005 [Xylaria palmicola]|nr:hypothetical protein F4802DRAFT_519005 [Xylaria palmicola]
MAPPPATPTPHRFLVPGRSQPRGETPGDHQFQATPRFALHSTPRPGPSSSLTPFRHRGAGRDVVIDSSPPPLAGADHIDGTDHGDDDHGSVGSHYEQGRADYDRGCMIDGDDVVQASSPIRGAGSDDGDRDRSEERRVKRRRISSSPLGTKVDDRLDIDMRDTVLDIESSVTEPSISEEDMGSDRESLADGFDNMRGSPPEYHESQPPKTHQPKFHKAPRFRPAEIPESAPRPEPLPDVFSPRRKGAKYIPGGVAAELRDWLVNVEAGVSSGSTAGLHATRNEEWVARIRVDDVRGGHRSAQGMTLVMGRQVLDDAGDGGRGRDESEANMEVLGTNTVRLLLAGPGRLSGLGAGTDVKPGALLCIARPTWEITLDAIGRWGVACDWVVRQ